MGIVERKDRERDERRKNILDAARRAMRKHGIENCSMERIAEEAELAKGTLYLYYSNRDEMLLALLSQDLTDLVDRIEKVCRSKMEPDKRLLRAISTFQSFASTHEVFFRTVSHLNMRSLVGCSNSMTQMTATNYHDLNTRMIDLIADVVQQGIDEGIFHTDKPAKQVVVQIMLALKGLMIVTHNSLFPPAWEKMDAGRLVHDTAHLMIKGLKCHQ